MTMPAANTQKNRYANAPRAADFTIDQDWTSYTAAEHDRWDRLFHRQREVTKRRACQTALDAIATLELSASGIPVMEDLSDRLESITFSCWRVHPPGSGVRLFAGAGHIP